MRYTHLLGFLLGLLVLVLLSLLGILNASCDIMVISPDEVHLILGWTASVGFYPTLIIYSFLGLVCKSLIGIVVGGCWAYH
jgi:hypothetical protein